jgi:hypothetical protein
MRKKTKNISTSTKEVRKVGKKKSGSVKTKMVQTSLKGR